MICWTTTTAPAGVQWMPSIVYCGLQPFGIGPVAQQIGDPDDYIHAAGQGVHPRVQRLPLGIHRLGDESVRAGMSERIWTAFGNFASPAAIASRVCCSIWLSNEAVVSLAAVAGVRSPCRRTASGSSGISTLSS